MLYTGWSYVWIALARLEPPSLGAGHCSMCDLEQQMGTFLEFFP